METLDYLILGQGVTGTSVKNFLQNNYNIACFDTSSKLSSEILANTKNVVISPGIPPANPMVQLIKQHNIPILSDIDLFTKIINPNQKIIAITGTNGKSTVVSLVRDILNLAGIKTVAGGNLGQAALDLHRGDNEVFVLELSSFQLEYTNHLKPYVAAVLNITDDHLDWHGSFANYRQAKLKIYNNAEFVVYNKQDLNTKANFINNASYFENSRDIMQTNIAAAKAIVKPFNIASQIIEQAVLSFKTLPNRLSFVGNYDEIDWYNDSKATNVAAAIAAIEQVCTQKQITLIAGGDAKGADLTPLQPIVKKYCENIILIGKDKYLIQANLKASTNIILADTIEQAVAKAKAIASTTVLLAPFCASIDMFKNYNERGEKFIQAIKHETRHN